MFGIFLVCKNNYDVLRLFFEAHDYREDLVLILDLGSSVEQIELGRQLCKKYDSVLKIAKSPNMQDNIKQAIEFFETRSINWILFCHQDVYPLTTNWRSVLCGWLEKLAPGEQGVVGVNVYHDREIREWNPDKPKLMTTARAPLELGNGYYDSRPGSRVNYGLFELDKPFYVETPFWSSCVIDATAFNENIRVDHDFMFFHAFDDLCFQFLRAGIPNIVLPDVSFAHDQSMKEKVGKAKNSSTSGSASQIIDAYGRIDHLKYWSKKWGFEYKLGKKIFGDSYLLARIIDRVERIFGLDLSSGIETLARQTYDQEVSRSDTLIHRFFLHDPRNGPLRYFELDRSSIDS